MKNFYSNSSEARIDIAGLNFLIVYGNHMNGGWCAILNWKVSAELSNLHNNEGYNQERIFEALKNSPCAWMLPDNDEVIENIAWELSEIISPLIVELMKTDEKWEREHQKDHTRMYLEAARGRLSKANDEMREYYDQHGMGKDDFEVYSQDPEWQSLNAALLKATKDFEALQYQYGQLDP